MRRAPLQVEESGQWLRDSWHPQRDQRLRQAVGMPKRRDFGLRNCFVGETSQQLGRDPRQIARQGEDRSTAAEEKGRLDSRERPGADAPIANHGAAVRCVISPADHDLGGETAEDLGRLLHPTVRLGIVRVDPQQSLVTTESARETTGQDGAQESLAVHRAPPARR